VLDIRIEPYAATDTKISLNSYHTVCIEFVVIISKGDESGRVKFRINVPGHGEVLEIPIDQLNGQVDVDTVRLLGILHRSHSHLAIVPNNCLSSWMGIMSDDTSLCALSIPGTHNSATSYMALPTVRCQAVEIKEQLENGVRFLDIRVQPSPASSGKKEMVIVHDAFPISLSVTKKHNLQDLLQECYEFLDARKTETVIISVKREGRGATNDEDFSTLFKTEVVDKEKQMWYTSPKIPTLGTARGKCVLFRRFALHQDLCNDNDGCGFGINVEALLYNTPHCNIADSLVCVQDFCELADPSGGTIKNKIHYIKAHLERSSSFQYVHSKNLQHQTSPLVLFVNFLSASYFWKLSHWPRPIANRINPEICEHLAISHAVGGNSNPSTGVVVIDFAGARGNWTICKLILSMNGWLLR
jgi:1-phosphatidylinositol phosphodiesterase